MQNQNFEIVSAYLGDERGRSDVTSVIKGKASSDGSYSVPVNSSLLPFALFGEKIELTDDEIDSIKKQAEKACGGGSDKRCLESKQLELQRARLNDKQVESQSSANIIKGRKLTVKIVQDGEEKTVEVPEGATFDYGNKGPQVPEFDPKKSLSSMLTFSNVTLGLIKYASIFLGSFLYILSIFIAFTSFKNAGFGFKTYIITAIAVFVPYSGYLMTFLYFAMRTLIQNMPAPT